MKIRLPDIDFPERAVSYATRPDSIDGLTIGFLDGWGNGQPGEEATGMYPTMAALDRALHERYPTVNTIWVRKPDVTTPVPAAVLDDFCRRVDLVINGEGL